MHRLVRRIDHTCVVSSSMSAGSPPGEAAATVAAASLTLLNDSRQCCQVSDHRLRHPRAKQLTGAAVCLGARHTAPPHGRSKSCSLR